MSALVPISYGAAGARYTGYLADGSSGAPAPGIVVAHEGGGLARHTRDRAARLAELGYVAFALDLYGEEEPPLERAMALGRALRGDVARLREIMGAGLAVLTAQGSVDRDRLAAIGYCMGGGAAIELARTGAPLRAVVGFHSGFLLGTPEENAAIRGKLLLCHGDADPIVGAAQRDAFLDEMREARVDWQLHLYGGVGHSFTNRDIDALGIEGFAYHAEADRRSWAAMLDLFGEVLGTP